MRSILRGICWLIILPGLACEYEEEEAHPGDGVGSQAEERSHSVVSGAEESGADEYRGDGDIITASRTYAPGIASHGYTIELPSFQPDEDLSVTFSLEGMPRLNDFFTAELFICPLSEAEAYVAQKRESPVPESHTLEASIVDAHSGAVIAETSSVVHELALSKSIDFKTTPCLRRLFHVNFSDVPENAELELRLDYQVHGEPVDYEMMIFVHNGAPTL